MQASLKPSHLRLTAVSFFVIWLQMAVFPVIAFRDIVPDSPLLLVAFFGLILDRERVVVYAFFAGFLKDLFVNSYFGLETASFVLGAIVLNQITSRFDREDPWVQAWATFLFSFFVLVAFCLFSAVVEERAPVHFLVWVKSLSIAGYTVIFIPVVFPLFKSIFRVQTLTRQYELF